jgi:hypothetical protein
MVPLIIFLLVAQNSRRKRRTRRNNAIYTRGELNAAADSIIHPLIRYSHWFVFLDEVAHFLIEDDPEQSILKFARYRAPGLLQEFLKFVIDLNRTKKKKGRSNERIRPSP